jgi:hypothetical protein
MHIERQFLKTLELWHYWCFSRFVADDIVFKGFCFLLMVKEKSKLKTVPMQEWKLGYFCFKIFENGGVALMKSIKRN